ncbi:MAG: ABC transporter permease [Verrucomicrobia bacterium]|nr:ABC transporter permease [Verrucomicrobiota bacterium]MDA1066240.1 ABC transporter permease [Verrucomicrobiota bacterium]
MQSNKRRHGSEYLSLLTRYGIYVVFVLLLIAFSLVNSRFLTIANILLILQQASPLGIAVVGMVFVLLVVGIDISVGRSMFFISTLVGYLVTTTHLIPEAYFADARGLCLVLGIVLTLGCAVGYINGVLVTRFCILPFIVTLATGSILRGLGLKLSGSASINVSVLGGLSNGRLGPVPYVLIIFILVLIVFDYVLRHTAYGRHLLAIGDSPGNAERTGIKVNRNIIIAYMVCGGLGALGGILSAGQIGSVAAGFGEGNEFIVISAAVLGGTSLFGGKGNIIPGAIIGILLITTIMNGLAMMNASPFLYTIVRGVIIFFAIALDSMQHKGELR